MDDQLLNESSVNAKISPILRMNFKRNAYQFLYKINILIAK